MPGSARCVLSNAYLPWRYFFQLRQYALLEVQPLEGEAGGVWVVCHEHDRLIQLVIQS